jgi:hypothetical protein
MEFKSDKKAKQAFADYAKGKPAPMAFINSYENGKQAVLTHTMTPLTSILKNDFGFSILVTLDPHSADEINKYDALARRQIPNGFTYKQLLNDDTKFYLKLKTKEDEFVALDFATPDEYQEVNLEGVNLGVTYNLGVWVNFEKSTAGMFLKAINITKA